MRCALKLPRPWSGSGFERHVEREMCRETLQGGTNGVSFDKVVWDSAQSVTTATEHRHGPIWRAWVPVEPPRVFARLQGRPARESRIDVSPRPVLAPSPPPGVLYGRTELINISASQARLQDLALCCQVCRRLRPPHLKNNGTRVRVPRRVGAG